MTQPQPHQFPFTNSTDCSRAFVGEPPTPTLKRGALAFCSRGMLGLVTCDEPQPVNYGDGNKGVAWTGIHLTGDIGAPWCSREPEVVGNVTTLLLGIIYRQSAPGPEVQS